MALGNILRKARESRKLTPSQVASATHMKVQTVQAIEEEDFSQMPAAIYCKGFIRLYAEYMGLDSAPLTREYVERFVEPPPPEPEPEEELPEPPPPFSLGFSKKEESIQESQEEAEDEDDLFSYGANRTEEPPEALFDHTVPEKKPEDIAPKSISDGISELSSKLRNATSQLAQALRDKAQQILPAKPAQRADLPEPPVEEEPSAVDTSPITLPNRQIVIISGIIAGVILLIFLISTLVGRFSGGDKPVLPEAPEQELRLPVEPPPPYID